MFTENIKEIRGLFSLSWAIKSYLNKDLLDPEKGDLQVVMFKVRDKGASKMHFRCVLRCVCAIVHLSSSSLYLVFDLNLVHKYDF